MNINSLRAHNHYAMKDFNLIKPHIMIYTETWLNAHDNINNYTIPNYTTIRVDRENTQGGGILVHVSNKFNIVSYKVYENIEIEHLCLFLTFKSQSFQNTTLCVTGIYNPNGPTPNFFKSISLLLQDLHHVHSNELCIICGDFNIHIENKSSETVKLLQCMEARGFTQIITEATHRFGGIIDHMYLNSITETITELTSVYYSDHKMINAAVKL